MRGDILAKILRSIASAVDGLDDSQLEAFAADLKQMRPVSDRVKKSSKSLKNRHVKVDPITLENALQSLSASATREEGSRLLESMDLSRKELERLARLRNIHVTKDDNMLKIKEKLVEALIGARLSSRAIRGADE